MERIADEYYPKTLIIAGGVACNGKLREVAKEMAAHGAGDGYVDRTGLRGEHPPQHCRAAMTEDRAVPQGQHRREPPRPGDVRDSQADMTILRALFPDIIPVPLEKGLVAIEGALASSIQARISLASGTVLT